MLKTITFNIVVLFAILISLEVVARIVFFGPQDLLLVGADMSLYVQTPERFIPDEETRERLTSEELDRLPYSARLDRLYKRSNYSVYGDLEPNRDSIYLGNVNHPYRVVSNSTGLRRKNEISDKHPDTVRVLCLGDSFTFGPYLPNDHTYPHLTEVMLNDLADGRNYEAINAGIAGYFLRREKNLCKERASGMQPDFVVLQVLDIDIPGYLDDKFHRPVSEDYVRSTSSSIKTRSVSFVKKHSDRVALFRMVA